MPDRIVISLPDASNEFQLLQAEDARVSAARLGLEIELQYADNNAVLQIQQIFKLIHGEARPRAIVVEPVAVQGTERLTQNAAGAGIGTAILNCTVDYVVRLRTQFPRIPIFTVGSDQAEIGRLQGAQIRALLPKGGTVLYIQGPTSSPVAEERLRGTQDALASGGVRLVVIDAHWSEDSAEHAVRNWLRLKTAEGVPIDVVAGQDDSIARGARRAFEAILEATPSRSVAFLGIDGVPSMGQQLVRSGQLTGTVIMPSNAGPALDALARWLRTDTLPAAAINVPVESMPTERELRSRVAAGKP
jgi:ribose transport system substrate-binding protein